MENFAHRIEPRFRFSTVVKIENMHEGKLRRFIIADADEGQPLAFLTVAWGEDLTKKHFKSKTVKGRAKRAAMDEVASNFQLHKSAQKKLGSKEVSIIEGDGSAWDTTCS